MKHIREEGRCNGREIWKEGACDGDKWEGNGENDIIKGGEKINIVSAEGNIKPRISVDVQSVTYLI
jgi:hypothetical protein